MGLLLLLLLLLTYHRRVVPTDAGDMQSSLTDANPLALNMVSLCWEPWDLFSVPIER